MRPLESMAISLRKNGLKLKAAQCFEKCREIAKYYDESLSIRCLLSAATLYASIANEERAELCRKMAMEYFDGNEPYFNYVYV